MFHILRSVSCAQKLLLHISDPEVGSTNQADLHPVGTAASPMVVTRLKKPWLLRMYTPKRLLGCFIFQLIDGIALGILLISLKYGDGLIIALSPMVSMHALLLLLLLFYLVEISIMSNNYLELAQW